MSINILCIIIAVIIAITSFLLERQRNEDRVAGYREDKSNYTFWGMLTLMKKERKDKKKHTK